MACADAKWIHWSAVLSHCAMASEFWNIRQEGQDFILSGASGKDASLANDETALKQALYDESFLYMHWENLKNGVEFSVKDAILHRFLLIRIRCVMY